jgi:hypothetical protein
MSHRILCIIVCDFFSVSFVLFLPLFLFQTQNGRTARDWAVMNNKAEVVALLDAHAVGGRVGVGEGVGERGKESEQNLSSKDNELLSVASTGLRLCFVTE